MATLKNTVINDTGADILPDGTTQQQPNSPPGGDLRYNTDNNAVELYKSDWISHPKEIVKDSLLTHIDFSDPNSWRGGPTTNIVRNTDLNVGWSKGYQQNIVWNDVDPPAGINSQVVRHDLSVNRNTTGYWYSYGNYATQEENAWYNVSIYVKTREPNFGIAAYTANNNEAGRVNQRIINVPGDEEWYRVEWEPLYNIYGSESDSLSFRLTYSSGGGNTNTRTWLCAPQMEKKSLATPFVPGGNQGDGNTEGTRGELAAQGGGVYDISGQNNHARLVNSPGWGHTYGGHLGLNGINTYMQWDGIDFTQLTGENDSWTLSCWASITDLHANTYQGVIIGATSYGGAGWYWTSNGSQVRTFGFMRSTGGTRYLPNFYPNLGEVYHWVFVNDAPGNTISAYVDGEFIGSNSRLGEINRSSSAGPIGIGKPQILGGGTQQYDPFFGNVYQGSIYDKALTAEEIKQNFDVHRNRYK